ncbi:MAG: YbfB/YjiJ family MFS transporter [Neisseriaceae bacterium]|nr:YbfB/YjiJ family MFS transporter [Neisseriaceae bacterium]
MTLHPPHHTPKQPLDFAQDHPLLTALALSLAAAVALGLTRFSYGVLLPPMRSDLGWSYFIAGAMHTGNALGYFLGALLTPALLRRIDIWRLLVLSAFVAAAIMLLSGTVVSSRLLLLLRIGSGVVSAFMFIAGGILAARLGSLHSARAGLLIGLYYGGTGLGIALSALLVPITLGWAQQHHVAHAWQWPWLGLGLACLLAAALMAWPTKDLGATTLPNGHRRPFAIREFQFGLAGYFMFGVGYIGYMTFVIALLKEQGMAPNRITLFYTLLGVAVVASSRLWAKVLERFKGGEALALFNGLLGVAAILPAFTSALPVVFVSGIVFGAVFLSAVASTTALVRHNLPPDSWSAGISAFTVVFALGQVVGPIVVGWVADGPGGLARGLIFSALALLIGAVLASRQKALAPSA